MLKTFKPDYILLNFTNYLSDEQLSELLGKLPEVTHISNGPRIEDVERLDTRPTKNSPNALAYARFRVWSENEDNSRI